MAETLLHAPRQGEQSFERQVLRVLPAFNLAGAIAPLVTYCAFALALEANQHITEALGIALYIAIGFMMATWFSTLAVAIACFMVMVMKGPIHVADPYPLDDSERPSPSRVRG